MAYLQAYRATGDPVCLDAAHDAARALLYGQLESGGWQASIDFDPNGERVAQYRNGKGGGKNNSTLDDNKTQASIRFLVQMDEALDFSDPKIHEAVSYALDAVLEAQFPNGGFPQVWTGPVSDQPILAARYPEYDWRTEGRVKEYWDYYTLNDDLAGDVVAALAEAYRVYEDERYMAAIRKLGDFLLRAQMPDPQPAWAQQYNYDMKPMWARRFEPPAIASDESQEVIETLLHIYRLTAEKKYLAPIPRALAYLKASLLEDGRFARFYELKTNTPLYMTRDYALTYDDSDYPTHYAFKIGSKLEGLEREYEALKTDASPDAASPVRRVGEEQVREVIAELDEQGRWVSNEDGEQYIESSVFCQNIALLSDYILAK